MRRVILASFAACALCAASVGAAPKGTASVPASITLNVPATLVAAFTGTTATIWPSLGDAVTFTVTFPSTVKDPRIQVLCYQNGTLVYGEAGPYDQAFLLGGSSSAWLNTSPGPASCVADLYYWSYRGGQKFNWLASTEFTVGGE